MCTRLTGTRHLPTGNATYWHTPPETRWSYPASRTSRSEQASRIRMYIPVTKRWPPQSRKCMSGSRKLLHSLNSKVMQLRGRLQTIFFQNNVIVTLSWKPPITSHLWYRAKLLVRQRSPLLLTYETAHIELLDDRNIVTSPEARCQTVPTFLLAGKTSCG